MANERYIEHAVKALAEFVEANYQAALTAIEVEQSLDADAIKPPHAYVAAEVPDDNRSPLVEIYADGWGYADQRNGILVVDCKVIVSFVSDCQIVAGERDLRRYVTAILKPIQENPTLAGEVIQCEILEGVTDATNRTDDSTTRFVAEQNIGVWVCPS